MENETWQVQDAKQRLSELLRRAEAEGPQFVTRHGEEVAVVIDIVDYRRLAGQGVEVDFKLALAPHGVGEEYGDALVDVLDEVAAERAEDVPRDVALEVGG
ncbi:type II toxin-antitoxin system Phd/YefM family antitoxin [Amycolatopsis sp. H20-H5]|uniref:type II toxin-antitoxin system Phd/YefM family antitoxin n=1 Tax=Amycolatopsis sp. H20-H5 TaxID=3046309 RepID=UPI002DBFBAA0|nr:type II toxin-antitoxin system Phd/YefM family antitoxin [Amycolatopsis sp. H20-H5]MEC3977977.1 type II toxin-antitoxin system Phd/YefM family antitoxin [Amycolatopsis sp. H20-H5]